MIKWLRKKGIYTLRQNRGKYSVYCKNKRLFTSIDFDEANLYFEQEKENDSKDSMSMTI